MKITPEQKTKIGIFTAVGLAVLVFAVFFIGNQKSLFSSTIKLTGIFNNVNGLQIGNNVRFAGINVGVVDDIEIQNDTAVRVTLSIERDVQKFIKKDSKMNIGSDGLMGDKLMVISPGGATTTEMVKDGQQIGAVNPMDVDKIITKVTKMADDAGSLINSLSQIVGKVNNGQGSIGRLLNDNQMADQIQTTVVQANKTMKNVRATSATLNEDLKAAQSNFLLKGYFNKKKKAEQKRLDSIKKVKENQQKAILKAQKDAQKAAEKARKEALEAAEKAAKEAQKAAEN
jgi:phospholipid/cholesterol/gamma-HCH transport system substrate-binding protein